MLARVAVLLCLVPSFSLRLMSTRVASRRHAAVRMASISLSSGGNASLAIEDRVSLCSVPRRACSSSSFEKRAELEALFFDRPYSSVVDVLQDLDKEVHMRALQNRLRSHPCGVRAALEEQQLPVDGPLEDAAAWDAIATAEMAPAPYDLLLWETPISHVLWETP
tara:strand:+ start:152 stop:646 length:495 start_codon:yes stop_codon:yes gene_type:complete